MRKTLLRSCWQSEPWLEDEDEGDGGDEGDAGEHVSAEPLVAAGETAPETVLVQPSRSEKVSAGPHKQFLMRKPSLDIIQNQNQDHDQNQQH